MRVMIAHVIYRCRGGEESAVEHEFDLLRAAGIDAHLWTLNSEDFDSLALGKRLGIAATYDDHSFGRRLVDEAIERYQPDVVHFHNVMPMLGPGAIAQARARGLAVVRSIHNYRYSCLAWHSRVRGPGVPSVRPVRLRAGPPACLLSVLSGAKPARRARHVPPVDRRPNRPRPARAPLRHGRTTRPVRRGRAGP